MLNLICECILISGIDIKTTLPDTLRSSITIVIQNPWSLYGQVSWFDLIWFS